MPHVLPPPHQFHFLYYFVREIKPKLKFLGDGGRMGGCGRMGGSIGSQAPRQRQRKEAPIHAPLAIKALRQLVRHIGSSDGEGVKDKPTVSERSLPIA